MHSILPAFTSELGHARITLAQMCAYFESEYFSGWGDMTCPRALNHHTAQGFNLLLLVAGSLLLALLRDLVPGFK